jgi:hypothetical protein
MLFSIENIINVLKELTLGQPCASLFQKSILKVCFTDDFKRTGNIVY